MPSRFEIAAVMCFTATLSVGCARGIATPKDHVFNSRFAAAGSTGALVATQTNHLQDIDRARRAAVFRDSGRYYK